MRKLSLKHLHHMHNLTYTVHCFDKLISEKSHSLNTQLSFLLNKSNLILQHVHLSFKVFQLLLCLFLYS